MPITNTAVIRQTLGTLVIVCQEVRFMTAITPAYDHAYQTICLGMPSPGVPHYSFRVPGPKSRYHFLPNDRSLCKELNLAMTIVGGLFIQMVVPVLWMVKPLLDGE